MATIAVIGFGQGGTVAAVKLAQQGHHVELFERQPRKNLGHPWYDDIRFDVFSFCELPLPPRECYTNKGKRLFISPDRRNSLRVPSAKPMEEISISRRALSKSPWPMPDRHSAFSSVCRRRDRRDPPF